MTDYISREAASDLLAMALMDDWEPEYAQDRLSEIPAADVRPVVRGKWKRDDTEINGQKFPIGYRCSACGTKFLIIDDPRFNFCAACGAYMRGGKQ